MRKVNKEHSVPLYLQVMEIVREMIDDGELAEGAPVMSERDIAEFQGISRMTANKAITKLVDGGYLLRKQGSGTVVAKKRPVTRFEGVRGLAEPAGAREAVRSEKLVSYERMELSKWIQRKLQTDCRFGYKVKKVYYTDGEPMFLESVYLSEELFPDLTPELVGAHCLYQVYTDHYGHELAQAEQVIRPVTLSVEQAHLLDQPQGDFSLQLKSHLYRADQAVLEYKESIFLSQKHDFSIIIR